MFYNDHDPAHFHAIYGEFRASIRIDPVAVEEGQLPRRALGLTFEWAAMHQEELKDNWERARRHQRLNRIAPLD